MQQDEGDLIVIVYKGKDGIWSIYLRCKTAGKIAEAKQKGTQQRRAWKGRMTALVLKKSNDSSEAKGNGERRCRYAFKEEENQSSCNKAEKFYEIVNPILKEQQNK